MRVHQIQFLDDRQLIEWIDQTGIRDTQQLLIQIYSYSEEVTYISQLLDRLNTLFPHSTIIGCTTNGEILDGEIFENTTVLSFIEFEKTTLLSYMFSCSSDTRCSELGHTMAGQLLGEDTKAFIVFTTVLANIEEFLEGMEVAAPNVTLAGGVSPNRSGKSLLFTKDGVISEGAVGVSLSGSELLAHNFYSLNWQQVGKSFTVTHASGRRVYSIDNMSVVDLYAKYLGEKFVKEIIDCSKQFPFLLHRNGIEIGRDVNKVNEDGSVTVSGNLYNGETVRLGFGDPKLIMECSHKLIESFDDIPAEAVLVYSCEARRSFMYNIINYELLPLRHVGPTVGFFSWGEFYHHKHKNMVLNHSMTLLILSENPNAIRKGVPSPERLASQWEGYDTIKAMWHLVQVSNQELVQFNASLEASEQRYKSLVKYNPDIVYSIDKKGNFLSVNEAFHRLLGYSEEDGVASLWEVINPADEWTMAKAIEQAFQGKSATIETDFLTKDNSAIPFMVTKIPIIVNEDIVGVYGIAKNISLRKEAEKRITYMAYHDLLTDLPNRTLYYRRLDEFIQDCKVNGQQLAVLFLDLDNFKDINDTFGHFAGDQFLIQVAVELKRLVDGRGFAARFGGDEFAVLLKIADSAEAEQFARKVIRLIDKPLIIEGSEHFITVSVGISLYPQNSQDTDALLKNADMAMYKAKQSGKNRYQFYNNDIYEQSHEKRGIISDLHKALLEEELQVYYQPIVDLRTGHLIGSEALVRWFHKKRGNIPPSLFVPIAEENGLIDKLGYWVLKTACFRQMEWIRKANIPFFVSVNVSYRQFQRTDFVDVVQEVLEATGLQPEYLHLEITESTALINIEHTKLILGNLRKLGVSISMDDFGTGYSSLSCVKDLSIDKLKIDRSFIPNISTSVRDAAIVKTIIALARNLNMKVLAEGVETKEQLEALAAYDCDEIQGYLFSHPVSAEQFEELLFSNIGKTMGMKAPM